MNDDSEVPTPKTTGSFQIFWEMSSELASKLDTLSTVKRKRLERLDIAGANRCDEMVTRFRTLARAFAKWPDQSAEVVAFERSTLVPELMSLQREALEMLT